MKARGGSSAEFHMFRASPKRAPLPVVRTHVPTTILLMVAVAILDGADLQLLPASFRALETDLGLDLRHLSALSMAQGISIGISGPFWGNLADSGVSRKNLIFSGMVVWGLATTALASASDFRSLLMLRVINGCALGLLGPVVQSLIADVSPKADRGFNFGCIEFGNRALGQVVSIILTARLSNQHIFGISGWRVAHYTVALFSLILAPGILLLLHEPHRQMRLEQIGVTRELNNFATYCKIPTFRIIALQGFFGTIPGAAFAFGVLYLQYAGLPDGKAGLCFAMFPVGCGISCVIGGLLGDTLARRWPHHGRIITAQISLVLQIPVIIAIFLLVPPKPQSANLYIALFLALGLLSLWPLTGCNKPILLELIADNRQASIMSWEKSIETFGGQFIGPSALDYIAITCFGYRQDFEQAVNISADQRLTNAQSLRKALLCTTLIPTVLCLMCFWRLHWTYRRDINVTEKLPLVK